MERGTIKISKNKDKELIIEATLVNGTLWMTASEMAAFLNVFVSTIRNHLRAIFNTGLLRKEQVTDIHTYEDNGRQCEVVLYYLAAIVCVGCRCVSW